MSQPAAIETTTAHCFKCRDRRTYTRLLASRPVFACDGCGSTREIEELGRVEIAGRISPVPPPTPRPQLLPFVAPKKRAYTNRRTTKETNVKNPLQKMVDAAVAAATEPLIKRIDELEAKDALELDADAIKTVVDERLAELAGGETVGPARRTRPRSPDAAKCPRAPHPGRHGQACRDAGYKD